MSQAGVDMAWNRMNASKITGEQSGLDFLLAVPPLLHPVVECSPEAATHFHLHHLTNPHNVGRVRLFFLFLAGADGVRKGLKDICVCFVAK